MDPLMHFPLFSVFRMAHRAGAPSAQTFGVASRVSGSFELETWDSELGTENFSQ